MQDNKKVYELSLSLDEVNLVLTALAELPAKVSMSMIQKIQVQCSKQEQLTSHED